MISGRGFNSPDAQLLIQDDMLFISASSEIVTTIQAGGFKGNTAVDAAKIKLLKSDIFAGFADFNSIMENTKTDKKLNLNFEEIQFSTDKKSSEFFMNFKDKNSNSLKQLFESINELHKAERNGDI